MYSDESQGIGLSRTKDGSKMDCDTNSLPSAHDVRSLDAEKKTSKGLQKMIHELQRIMSEPASGSVNSLLEYKENKPIDQISEENIKIVALLSKTIPSPRHSQESLHSSNFSTPGTKKDDYLSPTSKPREKADRSSSNLKLPRYKEFRVSDSDLPLTKEKLAVSLSIEEACGLLQNLMTTNRLNYKDKENQLDQISVDLLTVLHNAKYVCILMEYLSKDVSKDVPQNISAARVQAQKLQYLLSLSSRSFEKIYRLGNSLFENIHVFSRHSGDYHSNVDILLKYIMGKILEKCRKIQKKF